jgi:hypothetical protein
MQEPYHEIIFQQPEKAAQVLGEHIAYWLEDPIQ